MDGGYYSISSKKSGQIPAFGNWEYANDLPITQYFESARQAGLFHHRNSSGECPDDIFAHNVSKPPQKPRGAGSNKGYPQYVNKGYQQKNQVKKKQQQHGRHLTATGPPRKQQQLHLPKHSNTASNNNKNQQTTTHRVVSRAVDEDLYKIPPDLLQKSKRKRRLGFFSRCFLPDCMV